MFQNVDAVKSTHNQLSGFIFYNRINTVAAQSIILIISFNKKIVKTINSFAECANPDIPLSILQIIIN